MAYKDRNSIKKSAQLIEESKGLYKLLIDSVKDYAIFMLDPNGIISSWNPGAEKIQKYKAPDIIGKHFSIFYTPEAVQNGFPEFELENAKTHGKFEDEGWRVRKDGTKFWANVVIAPIFTAEKKHLGYVKVTRDLTQRMRNEALMQKNKELQRLNNDLDNFIYIASHDLKSPITNMEGLIAAMARRLKGDDHDQKKLLEMMHASILKLRQTVDDLAEIKKVQKREEKKEEVDVSEVIKEVMREMSALVVESHPVIDQSLQIEKFFYSRAQLKTVVYNLLSNALRFRSSDRQPKIKIASYTKEHPVLSIKDNGLGLTEDQVRKAFEMFRRFHTHVEGSGIGLYIVKRIVADNQGWIEVISDQGKGSEFIVHFPPQDA